MSILIDKLTNATTLINGRWYIAKPYSAPFIMWRLRDAWAVFRMRAQAVHFAEDEKALTNDKSHSNA